MLRLTFLLILLLVSCGLFVYAQIHKPEKKPIHEYAIDLFGADDGRIIAREWMLERGESDVVPALIRSLRYFPEDSDHTLPLLQKLTKADNGERWHDWVLWMQDNPTPPMAKNEIFLEAITTRLDKNFDIFFYPDIERDIRLAEIVWGGVRKDGIPALTNPKLIEADQADYIKDKELVFGISINGDTRAYPYRFMDWHEMLNDVIGDTPVSLAYCTLCGSGILYKTKIKADEDPIIFGSSGFLYRSNKLMYDQATHTLWNQFNGKPVVGKLTNSGIELEVLPLVTSTWGEWLKLHPDTKVLSDQTGFHRDYTPGTAYGAYFISEELMFPATVSDDSLKNKEKVFGLRISGSNKAWPLTLFAQPTAINDKIGLIPIVLIGDQKTETVRAYRSEGIQFEYTDNGQLLADNQPWQLTENELIGPDNQKLSRLPGHVAFWFAWSGYFPDTLSK